MKNETANEKSKSDLNKQNSKERSQNTFDEVENRRRKTIINILYWVLALALAYVILKYAIGYVAPFVIGFLIAMLLQPIIKWLTKTTKLKSKIVSIGTVAIFYSTIGLLIIIGLISLISYLISWIPQILDLYYKFEPELVAWLDSLNGEILLIDPNISEIIFDNLVNSLGNLVGELSDGTLKGLSNFLTSVPGYFVNLLFMIISSFFIATDYDRITQFIMRQLPERPATLVGEFKMHLGSVILQYIRSYSMILGITFIELFVGFLILDVKNALTWAVVIAIFDILPIVGVGTVLIPWSVIVMISGNVSFGIWLLVLYLIIIVIRNIIEPKIVGDNVGLHPIVTLVSMFVGTKLFGVIGLFGLPISLSILTSLHDKGAIKLYKDKK